MQVAILIFDRLTALDAVGPYEVLSRLPGANVTFAAAERAPIRVDSGALAIVADRTLHEISRPDVIVVPGGPGQPAAAEDPVIRTWLQSASATARWTTSVCTGALILGAAGLLRGKRATTHWLALDQLAVFGAEPVAERVVVDGSLVTAAGVSAGIDMGLVLAARIAGDRMAQTIQLGIEYDPQPPFQAGSPHGAPAALVGMLRRHRAAVLRR